MPTTRQYWTEFAVVVIGGTVIGGLLAWLTYPLVGRFF